MKKLFISLLVSSLLVGCGGNQTKLSPYEINSITTLRDTITDIDTWGLYYNESELSVGDFINNKGLLKEGTTFTWTLTFDYVTKNDNGLFERNGENLVEFDNRDVIFNDLNQIISDEFIVNENVNRDDAFLAVYEIDKVTRNKVYLNVKKIVLCKDYFDLNDNIILVEVY